MQEIVFTRHAASIVADAIADATVTRYKISSWERERLMEILLGSCGDFAIPMPPFPSLLRPDLVR